MVELTNKASSQKRHAQRRAMERFGINIGNATFESMVFDIQHNKALLLRRQSLRVSIWKVQYQDVSVAAVYDKQRKTVVTVYPLEWEAQNKIENELFNS